MLRGNFQRASIAILLIGMMIAPFVTCLQQSRKSAHSCCAGQMEPAQSLRADCCVVRTQLPATVVTPTLPPAGTLAAVQEYVMRVEMPAPVEHLALAVIPPLSPPNGAFILRI